MVLQALLLAVATFIFAIDQFSLTELLYRPIIACPIIGVILGDVKTGLVIGGTYELMMVGNMPVGGAQPPNAVLGSIESQIDSQNQKLVDSQMADNSEIQSIRKELFSENEKLAKLQFKFTDDYPEVVKVKENIKTSERY